MSRARENANISPAAGRNMVINSAMNVAQRATSVTGLGATTGYFTCDRWRLGGGDSSGRLTMTQTADGPNGISANCIKLDCTTADTSIAAGEYLQVQQRFEGFNLQRLGSGVAGAKQTTVSFYVKANAAFTFGCELENVDNSRQITKLFAVTTDWNRIELTFPADVDDGSSPYDDDNANGLKLSFWLHAGATYTGGTLNSSSWANTTNANRAAGIDSFYSSTDNNFFITGVQMEVGPVATELEQELISTTLQKCYRYFQKTIGGSDTYKHFGHYFCAVDAGSGGTAYGTLGYPLETTMRAIPTLVTTGTVGNYSVYAKNANHQCTTLSIDTGHDDGTIRGHFYLNAYAGGGGVGTGTAGAVRANNNADAFIALDAEL